MAARTGIAIALTAYGCLAIESILIHRIGDRVGTMQIALLRCFGGAALMLIISAASGFTIRSKAPRVQITRGLLGAIGFLGAIYGFANAPLVDATALTYTRALWMTAFATVFLAESTGHRQWCGVTAGMIGALLIIRPEFANPALAGYAAALAGAALGAAAAVASKRAIQLDSVNTTAWWMTGAGFLVTLPALATPWQWAPELLVIMIIGPLGTYLLLWAIAHTPVSTVAPFEYTRLVVQIAAALIVFHELPAWWAWCGVAAIVTGCLLQMRGQHDQRKAIGVGNSAAANKGRS